MTDIEYWSDYWQYNNDLKLLPTSDPIRKWILDTIPKSPGKSCIELGCYPGRFLTLFGELNFTLHGIDIVNNVKDILPIKLKNMGFDCGEFYQEDIFDLFKRNQKYDLVASFGLVEHFKNYKEVIIEHCNMVNENGYLVIEVPNFSGLPHFFLRKMFDHKVFKSHYLEAMNLRKWEKMLVSRNFEILSIGGIGKYNYYIDQRDFNVLQKVIWKILKNGESKIKHLLPTNHSVFSPYKGVIARKLQG